MVSKCHGREVREDVRDVAIKGKDAIGKQVSWKGSQGRREDVAIKRKDAIGKQVSWNGSQGRRQRCGNNEERCLVSKCHGREVREEGRYVAIKRKDAIGKQMSWKEVREERRDVAIKRKYAIGKQVSWKGSQGRRQRCGNKEEICDW